MTNSCYIFNSEKPLTPGIDTLCMISSRIIIEEKRFAVSTIPYNIYLFGPETFFETFKWETWYLCTFLLNSFVRKGMNKNKLIGTKISPYGEKLLYFFIRIIQIIIKWSECLNFSFRIEHTSNTISAWDGDLHLCI